MRIRADVRLEAKQFSRKMLTTQPRLCGTNSGHEMIAPKLTEGSTEVNSLILTHFEFAMIGPD
jgi:hypothetical protein